jgi:hypothetical protein
MGQNRSGTSIGFGGGEVVQVAWSLQKTRRIFQRAIRRRRLVRVTSVEGVVFIVNPSQFKVLQCR